MFDIPLTIGRYRVERILGLGGMGVVYQAYDDVIDREVAIKLIHGNLLQGQSREEFIERFQQEARAAARCIHPSIVAIYDLALHEGSPFLTMEFVDGVRLDHTLKVIENKCFTPTTAVHIALELLDALEVAHTSGIIHRDIKPANILLIEGGKIKITDFGIARLTNNREITTQGEAAGTPCYMSPEQWQGKQVDARSDLFSVGVLLQKMLIAVQPYAGENASEIAYSLASKTPDGGDLLVQRTGHTIANVIKRAISKHPNERFISAEAMAQALRKGMDSSTVTHSTMSPISDLEQTLVNARACTLAQNTAELEMALNLEPAIISGIEQQLAQYIGPIAPILVKNALKQSLSVVEFCDELSHRIPHPEERSQFLTSVREIVQQMTVSQKSSQISLNQTSIPALPESSPTFVGATAINADEIERVSQALAESQGPIAKVLVTRMLSKANNAYELWDLLAQKIKSDNNRLAFLKKRINK